MQNYVEKVGEKQGSGRNGPWTMYSVNIGGEWLGAGFKKPECREGDYISYDIEQSGKYKNIVNIKVVPQGSAPNKVSSSSDGVQLPVNKRDVSIHYQSCRNAAISLTDLLLKYEAVKLPAKQADKFDAAVGIVDELTNQFYLKLEHVIEEGGVSLEDSIPPPQESE